MVRMRRLSMCCVLVSVRRVHSVTLFALLLLALGAPSPAGATTLVSMPLQEMVQRSQKIVHGTVTKIEVFDAPNGSIWTRYSLGKARAAKGSLRSPSNFQFRCRGGSTQKGSSRIAGIPQFQIGDDVVVFYAPDNKLCQIMVWEYGVFRVVKSPAGVDVTVNYRGQVVTGIATDGLVVGSRPTWLRVGDHGALVVGPDTTISTTGEETSATVNDLMREFATLAENLPDLAPPADPLADDTVDPYPSVEDEAVGVKAGGKP